MAAENVHLRRSQIARLSAVAALLLSGLMTETAASEPVALSTNPFGDTYSGAGGPAIAANSRARQRLVVWAGAEQAGSRIYGRLTDEAGRPLGPILPISDVGSSRAGPGTPAAAYNSATDEYVVVWVHRAIPRPMRRTSVILAQRLTAAGAEVGQNDFRVAAPERDRARQRSASGPAVAWNEAARRFLVAWVGHRPSKPGVPAALLARSLSAQGRPLGHGERRVSARGPTFPSTPAVVPVPGRRSYVVAWNGGPRRRTRLRNRPNILWAAPVDREGRRRGSVSLISRTAGPGWGAGSPALAAEPRTPSLLLVWRRQIGSDETWAIFGRRLGARGRPTGSLRRISANHNAGGPEYMLVSSPVVVHNPASGQYQAAWRLASVAPSRSHCGGSTLVQAQALSSAGREIGPDDVNANVDMPGGTSEGQAGGQGQCPSALIWSLALAAGPAGDNVLVWSGAITGFREQVWTRLLSG